MNGKFFQREIIEAATKKNGAWVDYFWYKPGQNEPAHKQTFVKKVQHGNESFVIGAGFYDSLQ